MGLIFDNCFCDLQIDYVKEGEAWARMQRSSSDVCKANLETILKWSPYYSEADLLQQVNPLYNLIEDQFKRHQ